MWMSMRMLSRWIVTAGVVMAVLLASTGTGQAAEANMLAPDRAKGVALGLIDATGPLAVQCGLGAVGQKIRAGNVAAGAAKASLALSGAKKSCSGVVNIAAAVFEIVGLAEDGRPVYVTLTQSQKNKRWGLGVVKTCTVVVRAGESAGSAKDYKASFTCH